MTAWLFWRLVKWMGLAALGYGVWGTVRGVGAAKRNAGLAVLPVALLAVFVSGFGLLELSDKTFTEPWVAASLLAGIASACGAALHATTNRSPLGAGLAVGGLLASIGWMVFRTEGLVAGALLGSLGLIVGAMAASTDLEPADNAAILSWFKWIGRCEGASLLFLFGIAMPAKYIAGYPEVVAWTGWLHGVFFLLYVGALLVGVTRLGWSLADACLGLFASFMPFGTFVFERRIDT
jgi:integral membrane protein